MCDYDCLNCLLTDDCDKPISEMEIHTQDEYDAMLYQVAFSKFTRYNHSDKGKKNKRRFEQSENRKAYKREYKKRYRQEHLEEVRAKERERYKRRQNEKRQIRGD